MAIAKLNIRINLDVAQTAVNSVVDKIKVQVEKGLDFAVNLIGPSSVKATESGINKVVDNIRKSIGNIDDIDIALDADDSKVKETLKDIPKEAGKTGDKAGDAFSDEFEENSKIKDSDKPFEKLPKSADDAGEKSGKKFGSSFSSGFKKLLAGAAIFSVLSIGANAIKDATGEFKDFNAQLQNVESLGVKNVDALGKKLNELSKTTVDSTSGLTGALYQAVSAGVSGTQEQLVGFVEQASKVAVAGNATTEDAVNGLTSVLNSYKLEVGEAGKVSDIFFGAIKGGKTDFGQLNASLANVVPAAAAAGVSFEEIAGNLAQMTASGTPTAVATTQLRAAIVELQKPGKDLAKVMSGVTVELDGVKQSVTENNIAEVLKKQGLTATLQQLEQVASQSGKSMTQVFSSVEAGSAALALTGHNAESANKQLLAIKQGIEEGVSTAAYEAQVKSLDNQLAIAGNKVQSGFNDIFASLLPFVNEILGSITPLIGTAFDKLIPIISGLFELLKPIFANLITIIGPVIETTLTLIGGVVSAFQFLFQSVKIGLPIIIAFSTAMAINNASLIKNTAITKAKLFWDKAVTVATTVWTAVQQGLNLALSANPIGLIITIIGAMVTAVILAYQNSDTFRKIIDKAWESIKAFAGVIWDSIVAIGEFLGILDETPEAPKKIKKGIDDVVISTDNATVSAKELNDELSNPEPAKNAAEINKVTFDTGKKHKDNKKLVVDYFNAFKEGQDDLIRMASLEDEISRIRQERSKSTADELVEQQREIDALLDRKNKLEASLNQGFVINDAGKKLKITADEKVDLKDTLVQLDKDLLFASKDLEKITVEIEVDKKVAARETKATIAELQRERLEIQVDMGIKPKTDLLQAYQSDLIDLTIAIAGAETVEQEKLQNEKLKKMKQIKQLQDELNQDSANKAALAYQNSFNAVVDNFTKALDNAFQSIEPNDDRVSAIKDEIKTIDERKAKLLQDYKDGIVNAQQYNNRLVEIEADRVDKVNELNQDQYNKFTIISKGLGTAFDTLSNQYRDMANKNLEALSELSKKEIEYQELQKSGQEIPVDLQKAHQEYADAASIAFNQMAVSAGSTFASLLVQGKLTAKSIGLLALDTLDQIIPVLVAQIFGQALAQLGPIGGAIAAASGIGLLKGLVAVAKASFGGAFKGAYDISHETKGKPGPGDDIPVMVKKGESIVTTESTKANPFIRYNIKYGMNEDEYFEKVKLPKFLAKHGISLPSMNMTVMPLQLNDKAIKEAKESAKRVELLHANYQKFDKNFAVALKREKTANNELKQQNILLTQLIDESRKERLAMREDMKALKRDFKHNTNVDVSGTLGIKGDDLETVIKKRNRRKVY